MSPPDRPPMTPAQAALADALSAYEADRTAPDPGLTEGLTVDDALAVQLELLRRRLDAGATLYGWKVGLTSARARTSLGLDARPFGSLLRIVESGDTVDTADINVPSIEPELCFTIGRPISGPHVDVEEVAASITSVAAGFEINERRTSSGTTMLIADNLTNWAIVEGEQRRPDEAPAHADMAVVLESSSGVRAECIAGDEVDEPHESIAALAATLWRHGLGLEPGHKVITGAYCRYPVEPGESWSCSYRGIGQVTVTFR